MITPYEFDNANAFGNKEAVIVPNVPTLINKLSAAEINGIKDKINELVDASVYSQPIPFLDLRLKAKGSVGGTPNTGPGLEIGDIVEGFEIEGQYWTSAAYLGGDINDRANYAYIGFNNLESKDFPRLVTAQQDFTIPAGRTAKYALVNGATWYVSTPNNTAEPNTIVQSGTTVQFKTIRPINQYIVIFFQ